MGAWQVDQVLGPLASLLAYALAGLVLFQAPRRGINRLLAAILALEGNLQLIAVSDAAWAPLRLVAHLLFVPSLGGLVFLYPLLLGHLDAPMVRALRRPGVRRGLVAGAILIQMVLVPAAIWVAIRPSAADSIALIPLVLLLGLGFLYLFALPTGFASLRRAATPASRQRAKAFLLSFGIKDAAFVTFIAIMLLADALGLRRFAAFRLVEPQLLLLPVLGALLFVPLLAYGMMRTQVFDLDLRLRRGLSGTATAALVVGLFVLFSELLRIVAPPALAAAFGALAAAGLVLALSPLRGGTSRLAKRLLPSAGADAQMAARLEVYEAALEESLTSAGDGPIADTSVLRRLRHTLGLTERDHVVLEHALRGRLLPRAEQPHPWPTGLIILSKYRILGALGRGGSGHTYRVWDEELRRTVALKVIRAEQGPLALALREARAMAAVRSAHVLVVHDVQALGSNGYVLMEFADQGSLKDRLERGPLEDDEFWRVADGLLEALEAVHRAGLVHRDVKPSNVLLTSRGEVKLGDFGVAHAGLDSTQTIGLASLGTPRYMSPEQAQGRAVGPRSDLYSAALTLYEALTGRAFLQGVFASPVEMQHAAALGEGDLDALPQPLWPVFQRALSRDPAARFGSAAELLEALRAAHRPIRDAQPPGPAGPSGAAAMRA